MNHDQEAGRPPGDRGIFSGRLHGGAAMTGDYASAAIFNHETLPPLPGDIAMPRGITTLPRPPMRPFPGRADALASLDRALSGDVAVTLHGLGGVGKTELALHYADGHPGRYWLRGWVAADTPRNIETGLAALATRIRPGIRHPSDAAEWTLHLLQSCSSWLLVLDDVREIGHVRSLLGQLRTGHVLVTSRLSSWDRLVTPIHLRALSLEAATELIMGETGAGDRAGARRMARELGCHPLGLRHAIAYVRRTNMSLERFLRVLRDNPQRVYGSEQAAEGAERTVSRLWDITLTDIGARDRRSGAGYSATRLLDVMAWYAPHDIPRVLVAPKENPEDVDEAIGTLADFNMIDRTRDTIGMSPLLQAVLRERQTAGSEHPAGRDLALRWLTDVEPEPGQALKRAVVRSLAGHLENIVRHHPDRPEWWSQGRHPKPSDFSLPSADDGALVGRYSAAVLSITESALGPDYRRVANLSSLYQELGRPDVALPLARRAMEFAEAAHGPDDPRVAQALGNVAATYSNLGRTEEALPLVRRAYRLTEKAYGPGGAELVPWLSNLALLYADSGRVREAREAVAKALAIAEGHSGDDLVERLRRLAGDLEPHGPPDEGAGLHRPSSGG
ncbi:tetratricopeptide repeat protein [Sphaerisporangium sp. TRM90804]|uniref:tetratricopeptide repeat protein n=1 Tax=Sphaerisporangium sp. TRM90804 TaxID=3031113 RepID=UPI0024469035|nr:tetratricopeptide repeat protein [Sphaerisporangium sp. TRM90804]MDH2429017.1 tetratricopeptide repeat protein [Sphaerisporangium sp. TRM90804]